MESIFGDEFFKSKKGMITRTTPMQSIIHAKRALRHASNLTGVDLVSVGKDKLRHHAPSIVEGGEQFQNILKTLKRGADSGISLMNEVKAVSDILDWDKNGYISDREVANARGNQDLSMQLARINPLISKAMRNPTFKVGHTREEDTTNNEDLVETGYLNYLTDSTRFLV